MPHEVTPFDADDPIIESLLDELDTGIKSVEGRLGSLCFATQSLLDNVKAVTLEQE